MIHPPPAARADLALQLSILSLALPVLPLGLAAWLVARRARADALADPGVQGTLAAARAVGLAGLALQIALLAVLAALALAAVGLARAVDGIL